MDVAVTSRVYLQPRIIMQMVKPFSVAVFEATLPKPTDVIHDRV